MQDSIICRIKFMRARNLKWLMESGYIEKLMDVCTHLEM
jgi:hypothetical protein